jgi:pantetheine-phosphate adenylyltransferase
MPLSRKRFQLTKPFFCRYGGDMRKAVYAGSFDPITKGHLDIVGQALNVFDEVVIGVGINPKKNRMFDIEATDDMIGESLSLRIAGGFDRVEIHHFEGALVDFAHEVDAAAIVRGLRQVSDFNDEFTQHGVNSRLSDIPIVYFICHERFLHVSSSTAKELVRYDKPVDWLVDDHVEAYLRDAILL